MKKVVTFLIVCYQKTFSPDKGVIPALLGRTRQVCIYYPTCSEYAKEAVNKYGALKGIHLALKRLARCNPFREPGVDLVP